MRDVADRTVGIATNLLVTGLIVIVGVVLGRQMLTWWREASQSGVKNASVPAATDLGAASPTLQFGNLSGALIRSETEGTLDDALAILRRDCRTAAQEAASGPVVQPEALRDWLSQLADRQPTERLAGQWSLYELRIPLPMVAVVADPVPISTEDTPSERRVLSWGIAFEAAESASPGEPRRWTTFAFVPHAQATKDDSGMEITMPDGCQRLMMYDDGTESLIGFASQLDGESLAANWERVLLSAGWERLGPWRRGGGAWHGHFSLRKNSASTLDVQFSVDAPRSAHVLGFCRRASDSG